MYVEAVNRILLYFDCLRNTAVHHIGIRKKARTSSTRLPIHERHSPWSFKCIRAHVLS